MAPAKMILSSGRSEIFESPEHDPEKWGRFS
jgi:hypothetical protein